ncbi:MAG: sigma 54-interacting transcriptional regulator, partial [Polyangiales bacterium]
MTVHNSIELLCDRRVVGRWCIEYRALEVGRDAGADIVVPVPEVAPRAWLLSAEGGAVWISPLNQPKPKRAPLPPTRLWPLGPRHHLRRVQTGQDSCRCGRPRTPGWSNLALVVGLGPGGRRLAIGQRVRHVGRDANNDLVLYDSAVAARHCRIEPSARGVLLRDLGSSHGTWVQGYQVQSVWLQPGLRLRLGRTDVQVVEAGKVAPAAAGTEPVARDAASVHAFAAAARYATLPWPVLIAGESGVGKELLARRVHAHSARRGGPFVAVNAGALSPHLLDSELFGHARGAFTGADKARRGCFEQAHGGTLFLDEVGEMTLAAQARLLRVLEQGQVRPVGAEHSVPVDLRLVCATHRDLRAMARDGAFRADLYFRISQLVLHMPPLRQRPADILALAHHYLTDFAALFRARHLSDAAEGRLLQHPWPGNARELRNVLAAAVVDTPSACLEAADIDRALCRVGMLCE